MLRRIKAILRNVLGYELYRIYHLPALSDVPRIAPKSDVRFDGPIKEEEFLKGDDEIRQMVQYIRPSEAYSFGAFSEGRLVAACWYWSGDTYRPRGFWPLKDGEAKLIQIVTAAEMRGRGLAAALISESVLRMRKRGYTAFYARVWHSNVASCRAFEKAGWKNIAFVIQVRVPGLAKPLRFVRRTA